jgi:hypothetical protein
MKNFFRKINDGLEPLRENKVAQEIIFWASCIVTLAFIIVTWVTKTKLFLIGSGVGFLGIIFYFLLNPQMFKETAAEISSDKKRREGISVGLRIIIAIAIVVALMIILNGKLPKIDLTSANIYSISKESKELVKSLNEPLTIIYFTKSQNLELPQGQIVKRILELYKKNSKNIKFEIIDPDKRPDIAKQYGINEDGSVYLSYKDRIKILSSMDFWEVKEAADQMSQGKQLFIAEKLISSAIRYLMASQGVKIYFILGHKEKYTNDYQDDGISTAAEYLGKIDREVININLLEKGSIPDDASLLVIAAPKEDYSPSELEIVKKYIDNGGKFLLLTDFECYNVNVIEMILKKFDIIQQQGVVADDSHYYQGLGNFYPVIELSYHKITQKIQEYNKPVLVSTAAPLIINPQTPKSTDFNIISLGTTYDTAWNEITKDNDFKKEPQYDENKETKGVKHLGFVVEDAVKKNQNGDNIPYGLILCDSDLLSNKILKLGTSTGNILLLDSSVNFMVDDTVLLDIPGKDVNSEAINITATAQRWISVTVFILLEAIVLIIILALRIIKNIKAQKGL